MSVHDRRAQHIRMAQEFASAARRYQQSHPFQQIVIQKGLEWFTARGVRELAEKAVGPGDNLMGRYYQHIGKKYRLA